MYYEILHLECHPLEREKTRMRREEQKGFVIVERQEEERKSV
jgi:hypothetical protein